VRGERYLSAIRDLNPFSSVSSNEVIAGSTSEPACHGMGFWCRNSLGVARKVSLARRASAGGRVIASWIPGRGLLGFFGHNRAGEVSSPQALASSYAPVDRLRSAKRLREWFARALVMALGRCPASVLDSEARSRRIPVRLQARTAAECVRVRRSRRR